MTKYQELRHNAPILTIKEDAKEVIFTTISTMCDNVHYMKFKKNSEGEFKMNGMGNSLSNWQMKHQPYEIEWKADDQKWDDVIKMINSGTSVIESVKSR